MIKELDELFENGTLQKLIKKGLMKPNVLAWRSLYHSYLFEIEQGQPKMQAMENVATNFKVSFKLIEKIRGKFESPIKS